MSAANSKPFSKSVVLPLGALLCLCLPSTSPAEEAFAVSYGHFLFHVDLLSGEAEFIGNTDPCGQIGGLAQGPDGRIYAIGAGRICTIDPLTGTGTPIGSVDLPPANMKSELAIDAAGRFWVLADGLYRVDPVQGTATLVLPVDPGTPMSTIVARGDRLFAFTKTSSFRYRLDSIDVETFDRTPLFDLPDGTGFPTGAAFDSNGSLWFLGAHGSFLQTGAYS